VGVLGWLLLSKQPLQVLPPFSCLGTILEFLNLQASSRQFGRVASNSIAIVDSAFAKLVVMMNCKVRAHLRPIRCDSEAILLGNALDLSVVAMLIHENPSWFISWWPSYVRGCFLWHLCSLNKPSRFGAEDEPLFTSLQDESPGLCDKVRRHMNGRETWPRICPLFVWTLSVDVARLHTLLDYLHCI
jgi:hypothetical protein